MSDTAYLAALPGTLSPLDGERVLWQQNGGSRIAALPAAEAAVLAQAARFETRNAHLEAITAATRLPRERVNAALDRLIELGLLLPLEHFLPAAAAQPAPPPPLIAIRTCARPESLALLLRSLLDDERRFDARRRYVVIDDSTGGAAASATRAEVVAFARRSASEVRLLDTGEREGLLDALGPKSEVLAPLLDPGRLPGATGARAWNWATLLAAGGTLGMLDDDFRFPLRLPRGAAPELDLITEYALETEFFEGPDGFRLLAEVDEDPYALLMRQLGQPAGALLRKVGFSPTSARLRSAASLACLAPPARVAAICGGVYGELPFDSSVHLDMPNRATLTSLLRVPFNPQRLQADNIWQGRRRPHFMAIRVFTPLIIDARELLPPVATLGKADDSLFLVLLASIDPTALAMAVPASIGHFSQSPRDRRGRAEQSAIEDLNTFLAAQILSAAQLLNSGDRALRMAALATLLREQAAASDAALEIQYRHWRDRLLAGVVQPLYRSLRDFGVAAPPEWIEHVRRAIAANESALRERELPPAQLAAARAALLQMAIALEHWPALWAAAGPQLLTRLRPLR
jgi:hypothetical protein